MWLTNIEDLLDSHLDPGNLFDGNPVTQALLSCYLPVTRRVRMHAIITINQIYGGNDHVTHHSGIHNERRGI
jgi:hypothetical protein